MGGTVAGVSYASSLVYDNNPDELQRAHQSVLYKQLRQSSHPVRACPSPLAPSIDLVPAATPRLTPCFRALLSWWGVDRLSDQYEYFFLIDSEVEVVKSADWFLVAQYLWRLKLFFCVYSDFQARRPWRGARAQN